MKVLMGHCYYRTSAPSGEDSVFTNECKLLSDHGVEIVLFERQNDDVPNSNIGNKIGTALNCIWSPKSYRELLEVLRAEKPDIAHFHNTFPQMSTSVYRACQEAGVPVVQTLHNFRYVCPGGLLQRDNKPCEDCLSGSLMPALRHRCYRDSLLATSALVGNIAVGRKMGSFEKGVHRYIALTDFAKSRFVAGGLPRAKIAVKPNFLPEIPVQPQKSDYAIYVGRLSAEKGVNTLIEAWKKMPTTPLKIVGDGPLRAQLESIVKEHQLNVEFLGYRNKGEVIALVSAAKIQIAPSECYEGFPMVVLEAFAAGTPVAASQIGSLAEIIRHGDTGFSFSAGDPADLVKTVTNSWQDAAMLTTVSRNARAAYDALYTPQQSFRRLMEIYSEARAEFRSVIYKP